MSFTATVPDWAAGTATVKYNLFVDNKFVTVGTTSALPIEANQKITQGITSVSGVLPGIINPDSTVRVEVTDVIYSQRRVQYLLDSTDKEVVMDKTAGATTEIIDAADAKTLEFTVKSDAYTSSSKTSATYAVTGAVTTSTGAALSGTNVSSKVTVGSSANQVDARGAGYVTVRISGLTAEATKYAATSQGKVGMFNNGLDAAGITVNGMPTVNGAETKADIVIKVDADNKTPVKGDEVIWTIELWNKKSPVSGLILGYDINFTIDGVTKTQRLDLHGSHLGTITARTTVNEADVDLTVNSISVWTVDLYAVSAVLDGTTLKVTFNSELDATVGSDITVADTGTAPVKGAVDTNGKVLNISLTTNPVTANTTVNIDGAVKDTQGHANKEVTISFKVDTDGTTIIVDKLNHNG